MSGSSSVVDEDRQDSHSRKLSLVKLENSISVKNPKSRKDIISKITDDRIKKLEKVDPKR